MKRRKSPSAGRQARSAHRSAPARAVEDALAAALAHHRANRSAEAAALYREILRLQPGHADALHLFGVLEAQAGRFEEAVPLLKKAVRQAPRRAAYASDLGNALGALGRHDEAIATCRRAARVAPENADIRYNLGNALRAAGQSAAAVEAYRRALAIRADHLPAQSHLGMVLLEQGEHGEAVRALARAAEIAPDSAEVHSNLANALRELGELDRAEDHLRRALDLKPDHAAAHCNLGNVLQDLHRLEAAIDAYRRAIELDPDYATAHSNLGNALKGLGRFEEAVARGARAVALAPENETYLSNLGMAYIACGAQEKALDCFARATAIRHGAPISAETLAGGGVGEPDDTWIEVAAPFKLAHDAEQIRHLRAHGLLPAPFGEIATAYEDVLSEISPRRAPEKQVKLGRAQIRRIGPYYNRPLLVPSVAACASGALNPELEAEAIEDAYHASAPNMVFFDDFLSAEALDRLWRFCLEATIWYQVKEGYLGCYLVDGFGTALTLQIAEELRARFPRIFGSHRLNQLWAYKYDSRLQGIKTHADFAAVNVNFWITPDSANNNPDGSGLVVHKAKAPSDWAFRKYNSDGAAMAEFLSQEGAAVLRVPHRCNRAVIFDSDLFHRSDDPDFAAGYENRRINVTMLFGERRDG
ncbi:MAG: tetratricopeptide repeat protein [Alphaproteobacteria bacterium]